MLWRTLLNGAILPLLEAKQTRRQRFAPFEGAQRRISHAYYRDLDKVEEVWLLDGRINEDRTTLRIFSEAITDVGTEAIKHRLARVEKDNLVSIISVIQRTGFACLWCIAFQGWE